MSSQHYVFLPGLDGTADVLLNEFSDLRPENCSLAPFVLPDDSSLDYSGLCEHLARFLIDKCDAQPIRIVAESFSGPLAILLAHRYPNLVRELILVASFSKSPVPKVVRWLPWRWLLKRPIPLVVARFFFGADKELAERLRRSMKWHSVETLRKRIDCLLRVDVTRELSQLSCPITYVRALKDRLVSRKALLTITAAKSGVRVFEIDGPHLIVQTQPRQVWDCIINAKNIH